MILQIREQTCHLLADRAVFWEEKQALIVADIHLGKETVFRRAGIPIPEGSMEEDLNNLARLIKKHDIKMCIIVGDLIHAKSGLSDEVRQRFHQWLQEIKCEVHLILGNHDVSLIKSLPVEWSLHIHKEHLLVEPFFFAHHPCRKKDLFVWSGHLHPKIEIKNYQDRLVLRCFQIFRDLGILPALGTFVGGMIVKKNKDCRIYAIADSDIILI